MLVAASLRDPDAFETLYERYADRLYRYALARTRSSEVAEDIAGDTLTAVIEQLTTFDPRRGSFAAWLFTIANRRVIDHYRQQQHLRKALDRQQHEPQHAPDTLDTIVSQDEAARLYAALETLPEAERELVLLRYSAGLNSREIAEVLGIAGGAVRMRLSRARQQLAAQLGADR